MNRPSPRATRALDVLTFFMADVTGGTGPFLVAYLSVQMHWTPGQNGWLMATIGIMAVAAQTPTGALVDRSKKLPATIAIAALIIGAASAATLLSSAFAAVLGAQLLVALAAAVLGPAVAAISIGLVGRARAEMRFGRNQAISSAGNVVIALAAGAAGHYWKPAAVFLLVTALSPVVAIAALMIPQHEIDYRVARGADRADEGEGEARVGLRELFSQRALLVFAACVVLFHFANASMLMLIAQDGGSGGAVTDTLMVTAYVVISQLVNVPIAILIGRFATRLPRKPILIVAFLVLPVRGLLFSLTTDPHLFAAIQILDGIGAGIFSVMQLLVIADLTQGTGRFNLAQGAIGTAVGLGAAASQVLGGALALHFGFPAAFLSMSAFALIALLVFWLKMPETRKRGPATPAVAAHA